MNKGINETKEKIGWKRKRTAECCKLYGTVKFLLKFQSCSRKVELELLLCMHPILLMWMKENRSDVYSETNIEKLANRKRPEYLIHGKLLNSHSEMVQLFKIQAIFAASSEKCLGLFQLKSKTNMSEFFFLRTIFILKKFH